MKRMLAYLLALCMIFTLMPLTASAESAEVVAEGTWGDNITWKLTQDGTLTISGTGEMESRNNNEDYPWYVYSDAIKTVVIDQGITSVGRFAFLQAPSLEKVILGDDVTTIGWGAFDTCTKLKQINLPDGLETIGDGSLAYTGLTEIHIPDSVTKIGNYSFAGTGLTEIHIPDTVIQIGDGAFGETPLVEVLIPGNAKLGLNVFFGCTALKTAVFQDGCTEITLMTFADCTSLETVYIPDSVMRVLNSAFYNCTNLSNIYFTGDYITGLDDNSFPDITATAYYPAGNITWTEDRLQNYGGTLTWVPYGEPPEVVTEGTCGENLTWTLDDIGQIIFSGEGAMPDYEYKGAPWYRYRDQIHTLWVQEGVTNLGDYSFYGTGMLMNVILPESLERIGIVALAGTSLSYIHIPSGVTEIGPEAFEANASLVRFSVSEENTAFSSDDYGVLFNKDKTQLLRCPQKFDGAYVIPDTVEIVGEKAFERCQKLTEVTVSGSVKELSRHAFASCTALETVHLCEGLEIIGDEVFFINSALKGCLTIPASVTQIGSTLFDCPELTEVRFLGDMPEISVYTFSAIDLTVYYPANNPTWTAEKIEAVKGLCTWVPYKVYTVIDEGICGDNLTWVLTDDGVLTISGQGDMFNYTYGESCCDTYRDFISEVVIESGVTTIGSYAFYGFGSLSEVTIPDSVLSIGNYVFKECESLTGITIPDSVNIIGEEAFSNCTALTDLNLGNTVAIINPGAFMGCSSLTSVTIPDSVTWLYQNAFWGCSRLANVTFNGDAPVFRENVFWSVTANVFYPAGNNTWSQTLMQNYGGNITWVPYKAPVKEIASGWSGATQWTLTSDGVMTVYGSGKTKNYGYGGGQPWLEYADQITSVVIEEGVTEIGTGTFMNLPKLENVTLPESGLSKIGEAAFYGCTALKEIYIPDSIYTIWAYTFKGCTALESVRLSKQLIKIDQGAFENCTALDYIYIPGNVDVIGAWSFKGCTALAEADMQWADATQIRAGAFKNCTALTTIRLPAGIQILGDSCFYGIGGTSFTVPATVTEVQAWCFARSKLNSITFEGDAPAIGEGAFNKITLTAHYPADNATWTAEILQNYGGTVTWIAN